MAAFKLNQSTVASTSNIENIADSTQEQTATIEEITASANSLSEMADGLREFLKRFS